MWGKEWTIFTYKRYEITLKLDTIDIKNNSIFLEITIKDNNEENKNYWGKTISTSFKYAMSMNSVDMFKRILNSTIFLLMQKLEKESYILYTDNYRELQYMKDEEQEKLKEIAEEFLDNEGIENEEIREVYIEYYIEHNEKVYDLMGEYTDDMTYRIITDFYVAFLQAINDKERLEIIRQKIGQKVDVLVKYSRSEEHKSELQSDVCSSDLRISVL